MKSFVSKLVFASLLLTTCSTQPFRIIWGNQPDHKPEILRDSYAPHLAQGLPTFLKSGAVIGSVAFIGAFVRLYNKQHNTNHFPFLQTLNPLNFLAHPLQCLDDGLVGHMGTGHAPSYGVLGTSMTWVPKIDGTITAVDQTKRKVEAWVEWINRNVAQVDNAKTGMASVATHAKHEFARLCNTIGSYIGIAPAA